MPKFRYTVKDNRGNTVTQEIETYDKQSLIKDLQAQGNFIVKVDEILDSSLATHHEALKQKAGKKFAYKKIKLADLIGFAQQLTTMLEAGVTLLRSLEVVCDQVESEKFHEVLSQVSKDVEQGKSLSEAMAMHPKVFGPFWVSLVEVGEASGTMPMVLSKLAFYLEQQAAFASTIVSAVMYPIILFVVCIGAVMFFALVVGPKFEQVFQSMNAELPLITKYLLVTFRVIKSNIIQLTFAGFVAVFLFRKYIKTPVGREQWERYLLGLPTIGKVYKLIIVERFASQMAILVDSGVPILHALDITQRLVDNRICAKIVGDVKESVRQGELLAAPMARSNFFPAMTIQMITVGEETGELSNMLKHVANYYQQAVTTFMKRFGTLVEPLMLIFMGVVVGVILLAMFLPLFNLTQVGRGG